jgi:hypothetical protein
VDICIEGGRCGLVEQFLVTKRAMLGRDVEFESEEEVGEEAEIK